MANTVSENASGGATGPDWERRRRIPELTSLDEQTKRIVAAAVVRLKESVDEWSERFLQLVRRHVPGYDALEDEDIRGSFQEFLEGEIAELESLRVPDDALREHLEAYALRRVAQGVSIETLSLGYHLGSREMLSLTDKIAAEVGLPADLLLAIHDSTWEFANEAASVFARVQHGMAVERARFDAERRSAFARGVLSGSLTDDQIMRDAALFGLDARKHYVAIAARAGSSGAADAIRGAIAAGTRTTTERLLFVEMDDTFGAIAPSEPEQWTGPLVGVGALLPLELLHAGFDDAQAALATGERFGLGGAIRLADLGPKPLVLTASRSADLLGVRYLASLEEAGRAGDDMEHTVRVYLECDQQATDAARILTVHPNTIRYRINRFRELTGLDIRRTEDLVTTWWLLNRRR